MTRANQLSVSDAICNWNAEYVIFDEGGDKLFNDDDKSIANYILRRSKIKIRVVYFLYL